MATRVRRAREAARKAEDNELDNILGPIPEYVQNFPADDRALIVPMLGPGLRKTDKDGNVYLESQLIAARGDKANRDRAKEAEAMCHELARKYGHIWFSRGAAKRISIEETESGNKISERTIQSYINKMRKASKVP